MAQSRGIWVESWTGLRFVRVPAGSFVMGSRPDETGRGAGETPHS